MKRPTFITLVLFHFIFFLFVFLVYFIQTYFRNDLMADNMARVYAGSLFLPNMVVLMATYGMYLFWLFRKIIKKEKLENFNANIFYNFFFLFGLAIVFLNPENTFFCDTVFVISEMIAIFFAAIIIFKTKNKRGYAARIF